MSFINKIKNKLLVIYKLLAFKNLKSKTYNPASPAGRLKPSQGFTLIETLVAISILMVAVASPLTISQKGLASAIYAKDQIIASYLAQDAIEYLRNVSDRNVASGAAGGWLEGISGNGNCGVKCTVDTRGGNGSIAPCSGSCTRLYYDSGTHIYSHAQSGNSPFTRSVTVNETVSGVEALVTVNIFWMAKNTPRSLDFNTRIYNWR